VAGVDEVMRRITTTGYGRLKVERADPSKAGAETRDRHRGAALRSTAEAILQRRRCGLT
jgi:hypothetical protein